jgi:hypothetical protein
MKTPTEFLCKKCLAKMRKYDPERKQRYRSLKIKGRLPQVIGKINIKIKTKL